MIEHELVKQVADTAPCDEVACSEVGYPCVLPDNDGNEPDGYYCPTHAFDNGFCKMCGMFWGGVESFEYLNNGYCDDCRSELDHETADEDYEYDGDDFYDPAADY